MIVNQKRHIDINQESIKRTLPCNLTYRLLDGFPESKTRIVNVNLDPVYKDVPMIGERGECIITVNNLQPELYKKRASNDKISVGEAPCLHDDFILHHSQEKYIGENVNFYIKTDLQSSKEEIADLKKEVALLKYVKKQNLILKKRIRDLENTLGLIRYTIDPAYIEKDIFQQESEGQVSSKADLDLTIIKPKIKVESKEEFSNQIKESEYFNDDLDYIEGNSNVGQIIDEYLNRCFSEKNTFQCRICNYQCRSLSMLENHMNIHSNDDGVNQVSIKTDKLQITSDLDSEIPDSVFPVAHIKIYTKGNVYPCLECDYQSKSNYDLQCHMLTHGVELPHECKECSLRFYKKSQLITHSRTHVDDSPVLCSECGKSFISHAAYKRHAKIHSNDKPYTCPTCEYRCYSTSNLKKHIKTHTGERPFVCSTCDYKAIDNAHLKKHQRIHTGEKPYLCNECGKAFRANSLLKNHMLTHKEKTFVCETCGHKCTTKALLKRHVDNNHTELKPFPCSVCDWRFAEKSDLKRHSLIHTGKKPHICQQCGKRFRTVSTLNQHKMTHQNTLFKCSNCDYTGKTKLSLRMHMRREHGFYARDGYKFTYIFPPDNTE